MHTPPFMLFHPLCDTLISQVLKHVQYVYIFSFSFFFLPNELSFCTRELILRHITSRSTCNKRWRVVMAQYLTGWSSYFSAGKTLDKNFDIINGATYCAVARVQRVEIFSFNKWSIVHRRNELQSNNFFELVFFT